MILDVWSKKFRFKKFTFHTKVVVTTTGVLLLLGTLLLKATEDITWLGAFFHSVSARTAGFSTYAIGDFTDAGLFVLTLTLHYVLCGRIALLDFPIQRSSTWITQPRCTPSRQLPQS